MIFSTARSVKRVQEVRSRMRRCSYVLFDGRDKKAPSSMSSQLASLNSRSERPLARRAVIGSF